MDNASKAILIAGGILIAMLIIGIGVVMFGSVRGLSETYDVEMETDQIQSYNSNFVKFVGREDIMAQEIVTLVNFCKDYESKNDVDIVVNIEGVAGVDATEFTGDYLLDIIKGAYKEEEGKTQIIYYTCNEGNIGYTEQGLVNQITFNET